MCVGIVPGPHLLLERNLIAGQKNHSKGNLNSSEAEFKEFEPRFKFKPRLKYDWFHLKLYSIFQGLAVSQLKSVFGEF